uniref:Collectin-12 n=1 Tax=Magallana gigas TaxID=29159 RepID=K1QGQ3_MAGGI
MPRYTLCNVDTWMEQHVKFALFPNIWYLYVATLIVTFAYCTEKGSSLVEFEGPSDESWVWLQSRVRGFEVLWIGIVYSNINGTTEYVRLSTGNKAEYQNWDGEQKQNGNPAMCPALTNRITWMNYSSCDNGWLPYKNHCYWFSPSPDTFHYAVIICSEKGSKLLEIKDATEEKWVLLQSRIRGYSQVWIGLTDVVDDDEYVFPSSGFTSRYSNWDKEEPGGEAIDCYPSDVRWYDRRKIAEIKHIHDQLYCA